MISFLRSRRCRLPLAVILLLVTQLALAGQSCRAVMLGMDNTGEAAAARQVSDSSADSAVIEATALPCCDGHAPPPSTCLVPVDASVAAMLAAGSVSLPDLAPPANVDASAGALPRADIAQLRSAASAAGPPPRVYIVYHRFLS
jgi:hypothetical protein